MAKLPVSVIIPVYNEERWIEECLRSVDWAQEVVVVDGGSTDRTLERAQKYATKIISTENAPAETQRLKALKEIHNAWFLLLDADERVSPDLQRQIEQVIHSPQPKPAYHVLRRNYYQGKPVHLHHPDFQLRLFQISQKDVLPAQIHRIPQIQGGAGILNGELVHYFFTSVGDYLKKLNRYTSIETSYQSQAIYPLKGWNAFKAVFLRTFGRFIQYYFLKQGYRDGFFGFFYSVSSAYYEFVVAASLLIKPDGKS